MFFKNYKASIIYRIFFFFYTFLVLGLTLFFRTRHQDPLAIVWKGWTISKTWTGTIDTNPVLNILMLIPFTFFFFAGFGKMTDGKGSGAVVARAAIISFCFSLFIELMQIVTRLGTFQVSDLTYNTISGMIGAGVYLVMKYIIKDN